jgi:hypothetical protein
MIVMSCILTMNTSAPNVAAIVLVIVTAKVTTIEIGDSMIIETNRGKIEGK